MARPLRIQRPGLTYHVMSRGNGKAKIFLDRQDRLKFLDLLGDIAERHRVSLTAYCQMDNHYHLVLTTEQPNLSLAIRHLNGVYGQWWNRRHRRVGHVFQGRFRAEIVQDSEYLLDVCGYVALNPIRAHMVRQVEQWPWSSYRATVGLEPAPPFLNLQPLLELLDVGVDSARSKFRTFVTEAAEGRRELKRPKPTRSIIGDRTFARAVLMDLEASREVPRDYTDGRRPSLRRLFCRAARQEDRSATILEAHMCHQYSLREIADFLGVHYTTIGRGLAAARKVGVRPCKK